MGILDLRDIDPRHKAEGLRIQNKIPSGAGWVNKQINKTPTTLGG